MSISQGERFPEFALQDQDGRVRRLADLVGSQGLILYVYPKDDTPGCTTEALDFKARLDAFAALGYHVVGLSKDDAASHCRFISKHGLTFTLLTDADGQFLSAIGAWGEKSMYGKVTVGIKRSTFVVAADGTVQRVYSNVKATGHAERVLKELAS